jgi:hypothetical protein
MARKRDDTVKLVLRLPPQLHRLLRRAAAKSNQSLNSEMIRRLDDSFGMVARMGGKRFRWISEDTMEEEPES